MLFRISIKNQLKAIFVGLLNIAIDFGRLARFMRKSNNRAELIKDWNNISGDILRAAKKYEAAHGKKKA
jgi:hypothetical protein